MKFNQAKIEIAIQTVEEQLKANKAISNEFKDSTKMLLTLLKGFLDSLNVNSKNSSKPPSEDKNRKRGSKKSNSNKEPGEQNGHIGTKLKKVANPDKVEQIEIDRRLLPEGEYHEVGYEAGQVFDINISRIITEYRAQILEDQDGKRYVAEFPEHVKTDVQYGIETKVNAVYMSQFQLIPYQRIQDQFAEQMNLPLSTGTIFNFNKEAYKLLEDFDAIAKQRLAESKLVQVDETGINVNKKGFWLHVAANDNWTYYFRMKKEDLRLWMRLVFSQTLEV